MTQRNGPTTRETAMELLVKAQIDLQAARVVMQCRATKETKHEAFRLLSGVQSACETLKIAIDPW